MKRRNRRTATERPFSLLLPLLMLQCGRGCVMSAEQHYREHMPWGYVYRIGTAREITEWTLAQDEPQEVVHGLLTLGGIPNVRSSAKEARDAVDGYVRVHRKLKPHTFPENQNYLELWRRVAEMDLDAGPQYRAWLTKKGPSTRYSASGIAPRPQTQEGKKKA